MKQFDEVIKEIPVHLSKDMVKSLYLLRFPYEEIGNNSTLLYKGRIKPNTKQLDLAYLFPTATNNFDDVQAEVLRYTSSDNNKSKEDLINEEFWGQRRMDNLSFSASPGIDKNDHPQEWIIGQFVDNSLHLMPYAECLSMVPSFGHIKLNEECDENNDVVEDEPEEEAKKVTVHFEKYQSKDASERSKFYRERSFAFQKKLIDQEDWIPLKVYPMQSEQSEQDTENLFSSEVDDINSQFSARWKEYFSTTFGAQSNDFSTYSNLIDNSINERVLTLMKRAIVASFKEIIHAIKAKKKEFDSVLTALQEYCILVQGNWVVKSSLVFPTDESSGTSVSNEVLAKARDYILYQFTKDVIVKREQLDNFVEIPNHDRIRIMESFSENQEKFVYKFLLPPDVDFIASHWSIVQKQQMVWKSRQEQFNQLCDKLKADTVPIQPKTRRRKL